MNDDFFIGWANRWPRWHGRALWGFALAMLVLLPATGVLLARTQTDPGGGAGDWGDQRTVTGVFTALPYPVIHLADGHAMLLSGAGKYNVEIDPRAFDGKTVTMSGAVFKRGSIDMLVVSDPSSVQAVAPGAAAEAPAALGKWRDLRRQMRKRRNAARHRPRPQGLRQPVPDRRRAAGAGFDRADRRYRILFAGGRGWRTDSADAAALGWGAGADGGRIGAARRYSGVQN
jgi:hypothetical protein